MSVDVKICGINSLDAMKASLNGGARYTGFVFHPSSPRAVSAAQGADLGALAPATVKKVGLFVDPSDDELDLVLNEIKLDIIQLHGTEMPERVAQIRARTRTPIMKAIAVATPDDLRNVSLYEPMADWLLFDAKSSPVVSKVSPLRATETAPDLPPPSFGADIDLDALDSFLDSRTPAQPPPRASRQPTRGLPGGNGTPFDWNILRGRRFAKPWMLAGGINAGNLADAVGITMAKIVDISSGVEDRPGVKNPDKIRTFLALAAAL